MKRAFNPKPKQSQSMSIITSPWFVIGLVVVCFGILTPKIFMPLFMQLFGFNTPESKARVDHNMDPRMRPPHGRPPLNQGEARSSPQFGRPGPAAYSQQPAESGSGKSSLLTMLLPVYAIGIGIYMFYTLCKVFKKDDEKQENDSDFEDCEKRNIKFRENMSALDQVWDPETNEFKSVDKLKKKLVPQPMSEETEDELNEYARYNSVDPEYLAYLKQSRKKKKDEKKALLAKTAAGSSNGHMGEEVALTPGAGLTSITNTNVLMNDTLERMKHSLNKINTQLVDVERKGHPMEDPELDGIRLQLTQTELQMQKIMTIVNSVSASLDLQSNDDDDYDEEYDDHQQEEYERFKRNSNKQPESTNTLRSRKKQAKKYRQQIEEDHSRSSYSLSSNDSQDQISSQDYEDKETPVKGSKKKNLGNVAVGQQKQEPEKVVNSKNRERNLKKKQRKKAKAQSEC